MATQPPAAQDSSGPVKTVLTWDAIASEILWLKQRLPSGVRALYGVPTGGSIVGFMLSSLSGFPLLDSLALPPDLGPDSILVVDDLVDSGRTLRPFAASGFMVDALIRKPHSPADLAPYATMRSGWLTFPWENHRTGGAEDAIVRLLEYVGEDPTRDGLADTPERVLRAWKQMTAGYAIDPVKLLERTFALSHDEMIILRGARFTSVCEHHLLPFSGTASVGYVPGPSGRVVGISKLARVVDAFARRLQIQERLTDQIARAIQDALAPRGTAVVLRAHHSCMGCRGVQQPDSEMVTSSMLGLFRDDVPARAEFLELVRDKP